MDQSYRAKRLRSMKKHKNNHLNPSNSIVNVLTAIMCILVCSNHFLLPSSSLEPYIDHFLSITLPHMKATFLHPKCIFVVVNAIIVFLIGQSMLGASPSASSVDLYTEYVNQISRDKKDFKVYHPVQKKKNNKERDAKEEDCIREGQRVQEVGAKGTRKLLDKGKVEEEEEKEELPAEEVNEEVGAKGTRKLLQKGKVEEEEKEELPAAEEVNEEVGAKGTRKLLQKGKVEEEEYKLPAEELNGEVGAQGTGKLLEKAKIEEEEGLFVEDLNRRIEAFIFRVNKRRSLDARSLICIET